MQVYPQRNERRRPNETLLFDGHGRIYPTKTTFSKFCDRLMVLREPVHPSRTRSEMPAGRFALLRRKKSSALEYGASRVF